MQTPDESEIEMNELDDVIAPLSPIKSVHRRPSTGSPC
jgi:hypothetical protein